MLRDLAPVIGILGYALMAIAFVLAVIVAVRDAVAIWRGRRS